MALLHVGGIVRHVDVPGVLGSLFSEIDDRADNFLALIVREQHRAKHDILGQFLGFRFDHHHGIAGGGDDEVERAGGGGFLLGVERVFAILIADTAGTDRAHERHARDRQRRRSRDHRDNIGLGLAIIAQHVSNDVDLVVEPFREQRAHRAVDQAGDQRLLFGRAALALEKAARDAPGGEELFLIMDGEREEILPVLYRFGSRDRAKHDSFAQRGEDRAVCLTGNAAGFQSEGLSAPLQRYGFDVEHVFSFSPQALLRCGICCRVFRPGPVRGA